MKKLYILLVVSVLFLITCKKIPELKIYNLEISEESVTTTTRDATITAKYSFPTEIYDIKVLVNTSEDMNNAILVNAALENNAINAAISDLVPSTNYYYCFRYSNGINLVDTDTKTFKTQDASLPAVTTKEVTNITTTTATSGGNVTSDGGANVTARGVCWNTEHTPTTNNSHTSDGDGMGEFTSLLTELIPNTTYYIRAYTVNTAGLTYGDEISFTTIAEPTAPVVNTIQVTTITPTSARIEGNITSSGGADVTERGVCWGTSQNPTISGSHSSSGTGTGSFVVDITGLTENTTYYARAYAKNSVGTAYGDAISFTTLLNPTIPTVTTNDVSNITTTSATCGGNVTSAGDGTITTCGVCWNTLENPTISNSHTSDGAGTGEFTSSITGLTPNTTYYVRAYATNEVGTAYGEQKTFTTNNITMPTVTTKYVTDVTKTTAICGGNVASAGNGTVSARGVCYSTSQNPTITNTHTSDGTGTGEFTSSITGLTPNTTYYVRAYATNEAGTAYGPQRTFITLPTGAIDGLFTVGQEGQRVCFSQGNLQYQASTNTWRFAENQWNFVGGLGGSGLQFGNVSGSSNNDISSSYSGWIDLFGWGTSGYNHGAVCYQPWSTSETYSDYYAYGNSNYNLYDQTGQADWGYNQISNGGNQSNQWRTLTKNEWDCVFNTRYTISGIRYAKAEVNGVNGVILLPDDWSSSYYSLNNTNTNSASYSSNTISASQWNSMEQHGAVFLPITGHRNGTYVNLAGNDDGVYWSATYSDSDSSWELGFTENQLCTSRTIRHQGFSVRLVHNY